jgi:hypothetical protein
VNLLQAFSRAMRRFEHSTHTRMQQHAAKENPSKPQHSRGAQEVDQNRSQQATKPNNERAAAVIGLYLAILGALVAPLGFFATVTWPSFLFLLIAAGTATYAIFHLPLTRRHGDSSQRRWYLSIAITVILFLAAFAISDTGDQRGDEPQRSAGSAQAGSCIPPGSGMPEYQAAFAIAHARGGGKEGLGCGIDRAKKWGDGISQNFRNRDGGESVIAATTPEEAYVLIPRFHECINSAVQGAETFPVAGYPREDPVDLRDGWKIELGAGMSADKGRNVVLWKNGRKCFWVPSEFSERYMGEEDGPHGHLGYPTSNIYGWQDGQRQDFERGSMVLENGQIVVKS